MVRRRPKSTRTDTLFPYTTLFRAGLDQLAVRIGLGLGRKQTVDEQQFLVERHLGHDRERPRSCLAYVGRRRGGGNRHRGKRGRLLRGKRHRLPKQQDRDRESPWPIDQRKLPLVADRKSTRLNSSH